MTDGALIIDPPAGLGSSVADLRAWIEELEGMEPAPEIERELERAQLILEVTEKHESDDDSTNG